MAIDERGFWEGASFGHPNDAKPIWQARIKQ